jgi:hypothetical protein
MMMMMMMMMVVMMMMMTTTGRTDLDAVVAGEHDLVGHGVDPIRQVRADPRHRALEADNGVRAVETGEVADGVHAQAAAREEEGGIRGILAAVVVGRHEPPPEGDIPARRHVHLGEPRSVRLMMMTMMMMMMMLTMGDVDNRLPPARKRVG